VHFFSRPERGRTFTRDLVFDSNTCLTERMAKAKLKKAAYVLADQTAIPFYSTKYSVCPLYAAKLGHNCIHSVGLPAGEEIERHGLLI
jgi:hypothetical protein